MERIGTQIARYIIEADINDPSVLMLSLDKGGLRVTRPIQQALEDAGVRYEWIVLEQEGKDKGLEAGWRPVTGYRTDPGVPESTVPVGEMPHRLGRIFHPFCLSLDDGISTGGSMAGLYFHIAGLMNRVYVFGRHITAVSQDYPGNIAHFAAARNNQEPGLSVRGMLRRFGPQEYARHQRNGGMRGGDPLLLPAPPIILRDRHREVAANLERMAHELMRK